MGGATYQGSGGPGGMNGLSPRGRGNQRLVIRSPQDVGSIPAWAGQPISLSAGPVTKRVYPRVGGATHRRTPLPLWCGGLSPRGRGNQSSKDTRTGVRRSIPAWAGQPII